MAGETDLCCCLDRNKPNFLIKVNLRFSTPSRPCVDSNSNFELKSVRNHRNILPLTQSSNSVLRFINVRAKIILTNRSSLFIERMILHFVITNRTEHHRLVRYNWEEQLTEISLSKINDNDISQNEIRQKILLVKYLSTMHKISSKFSPSEIQGWKNSILKLEKSILQSKQHGELSKLSLSFSESKYEEVHCFYYASFQKMETKRLIRITIFFQSLERFEKKRCSIFYLRTFQNIDFSILPRLPIQFRISISKTSSID